MTSGRDGAFLVNCLAESNTSSGFGAQSAQNRTMLIECGVFGNGTDVATNISNGIGSLVLGLQTAGSSFFVAASSGNFALNSTAGSGALARGTGYESTYPRGTTTSATDIGTAQHADPAVPVTTNAFSYA